MSNIFSRLFGRRQNNNLAYARMLDGSLPVFSQFGNNILASEVVEQAIRCIVNEMKKLQPQHIRRVNNDIQVIDDKINKVLNSPNETMTKADFLEKIIWNLLVNDNSFVIPTYDKAGQLQGLYPIQPTNVIFVQDVTQRLYVEFDFASGYSTTIPYSDVIHLKRNFNINPLMGGDEQGQQNNNALLKMLQVNDDLLNGISKSLRGSYAVNGVIKYNTMLAPEKMEENIAEFEKRLNNNESGILPIDTKNEYIPIKKDIKLVDRDTLEFVDSKILRHFGVSLPILTGDFTPEQMDAFYQKTLEPIIVTLQDAFTQVLLTQTERSFGNEIRFYAKDLIFMTQNQKIEWARLMGDRGSLYENELRQLMGLQPLKELEGVRMMSLNYAKVGTQADVPSGTSVIVNTEKEEVNDNNE